MVFEYFFLLHDSESQELKAKLLGFSKLKDNSNSKQTRIDLWEPFYYIIEIYIVHKRLPKKIICENNFMNTSHGNSKAV